jgi:alkylation response protein AidB-like acyl-CoA dehydrogenase
MDFHLSDEQLQVRTTVQHVMKRFEGRRGELMRKVHKERAFPHEIWDAVAQVGLLGSFLPEEYGGSGMGLLGYTVALEEISSIGFGNALLVLTAMDALCILRNGPEQVKKKYLPGIAEGKYKFCFGLTEADAGSNTFRIKTSAVKRDGHYVINGSKTFITGVDVADYMLCVTRTKSLEELGREKMSKAYGLSLFIVDTKAKGLTLQVLPTRGIEGMNQFSVFFDDVEVPAEDLVGEEHAGAVALFKGLNPERILAAATAVGASEYCLKKAVEYANVRRVFRDTPIGQYQAIQHPLAEAKIYQEAVRLLAYKAAWAYDQGLNPGEVGMYANMAKYLAAQLGIMAVDRAIETMGGSGFSEDSGVVFLWDAMRLLKTAPVSNEMILNYISEHVLNLPRSY